MEVILVALAGFLVIGTAWSLANQHDGPDTKMRHERLLRELRRHD